MKKGMVCLSIITILTLSIPNVAIVSASKQTTNVHSNYAMDVPVKKQPQLVLLFSNNEKTANTTVNTSVELVGLLATVTNGKINSIEGATINIQRLNSDETWYTADTLTTMSGKFSGYFKVEVTPKDPGTYIFRAAYDGNNTYAPTESDMVVLTVH